MKTIAIIWIIGLSLFFPLVGGIEPGTTALILSLLFINLIYIFAVYLTILFEQALNLQSKTKNILKLSLQIVYILVICYIFKDRWWFLGSVLLPVVLCERR